MAPVDLMKRIDTDRIRELMESFHSLTGIPSTLIDTDGNILVTREGAPLAAGWQRICLDFHRKHPEALRRCRESDTCLSRQMEARAPYACYKCLNGLMDAAVPVVLDGEHVVNLFTGQFFFEPPDREAFRKQATEFGFDEDDYLSALDEVPVIPQKTVEQGLVFLTNLAKLIGEMALAQGRLLRMNHRIEQKVEERTRELHEANRALQEAKNAAETEAEKRRRMETRAWRSLTHVRDVLENTTDAFFEVDRTFRVTYVNEKAVELLGKTRYELVNRNLWQVFPEAVGSRFDVEYHRALAEQKVVEFEEFHAPRNTWYEVHAYPTPESLSVYFRDISRRKRTEEALLEYHRVIESSDDIIAVVDRKGTYRLVNQAFLKQHALERGEVVGLTVADVLGKEVFLSARPFLDRCFRGETIEYEMPFEYPEGTRTMLVRYNPIRNTSGEIALAAALIRDVTALRKTERELESFFNLSMDMLCVAGFDGHFKHLNPAWERTLGWSEDELKETPWIEFVHPDDREPTLHAGRDLVEGREVISFENRYRCKDGTYRWLSWNSRPLPDQGLIYAAVRDVTAAKETEGALRERDRLQGALETAGAVCHELNQPLQAITGFSDLLLLEVGDQEKPAEKVRRIQESVRLIGSITRKLAGITRYQTMDYIQGKIIDIDRASKKALVNDKP